MVFGKKEDGGGFEITQELVQDTVVFLQEQLTGSYMPFLPNLTAHFLRPLVHLSISGAPMPA